MEPPWSPSRGLPLKNLFRRPCLLIVTDFKPFLEVPVTFLIVVKICESQGPTHGAPMEPLQRATFEKSVPASLLTYCGMLGINCTQISHYVLFIMGATKWLIAIGKLWWLPLKISSAGPWFLVWVLGSRHDKQSRWCSATMYICVCTTKRFMYFVTSYCYAFGESIIMHALGYLFYVCTKYILWIIYILHCIL